MKIVVSSVTNNAKNVDGKAKTGSSATKTAENVDEEAKNGPETCTKGQAKLVQSGKCL